MIRRLLKWGLAGAVTGGALTVAACWVSKSKRGDEEEPDLIATVRATSFNAVFFGIMALSAGIMFEPLRGLYRFHRRR